MRRPGAAWGRGGPGGFTLLEMVVAIAVFALIAAAGYAALGRGADLYAHLTARSDRSLAVQGTLDRLARDLRYRVERPVRDEYGQARAALETADGGGLGAGELLRLTTGLPDPLDPRGARLQRVAWRLEAGGLYRAAWEVLDRAPDSRPRERLWLEGVAELSLRFLSRDRDGGPVAGQAAGAGAVEILLVLADGRRYRRLVEFAGAP